MPSRATLIVSPSSILFQWKKEIEKHILPDKCKVFIYLGVKKHKFINPAELADYDIVLSSYEIFKKELGHVDVPHGKYIYIYVYLLVNIYTHTQILIVFFFVLYLK